MSEDVKKAAKLANVNHIIEAFPKGYRTEISEDSDNISAGEKQLITIARAMVANPPMMILDEATAMLDPRGRKEGMDVVLKLNREEKITVILITHFAEEAMLADRAVVMHQGQIVMQGRPNEIFSQGAALEKYALVKDMVCPKPKKSIAVTRKKREKYATCLANASLEERYPCKHTRSLPLPFCR